MTKVHCLCGGCKTCCHDQGIWCGDEDCQVCGPATEVQPDPDAAYDRWRDQQLEDRE